MSGGVDLSGILGTEGSQDFRDLVLQKDSSVNLLSVQTQNLCHSNSVTGVQFSLLLLLSSIHMLWNAWSDFNQTWYTYCYMHV
jgi:hypothetical protein